MAALAATALALAVTGATAHGAEQGKQDRALSGDRTSQPRSSFSAQHDGTDQHLPSARENIELVSKLELKAKFGNVVPGQIADVAVFKNAAYLMSWSTACERGGTFVVDITDPANPKEIGHVPAPAGSYHGEGAHAITLNTSAFRGDVLAVNNEPCAGGPGGFDLIDVSNPAAPVVLVAGFGDTGEEGSLTGTEVPHSNHSIFLYQHAGKAYAVTVDNIELHDVDIFDITNPRVPVPVAEHDLVDRFDLIDAPTTDNLYLHHDSVVKIINGQPILLTSYWDAGYVVMNIADPANPVYISDSTFAGPDPLTGLVPQEGNAHYAEFSHDNRFILAADEDFTAHRPKRFAISTGPNAGEYPAVAPSGSTAVAVLPDGILNGPVVYGGYGCPPNSGDTPGNPGQEHLIPQRADYDLNLTRGEEAILVLSRGPTGDPAFPNPPNEACFPGEKVGAAQRAGWDAVVLVNRHVSDIEAAFCGSGAYDSTTTIPSICTSHEAFHLMFNDEPNNDPDYTPNSEPAVGAEGERVESEAVFDSWGYAHLFENNAGKLREIDAYAIEEALDPRFAFGFGDLSIHEWATDPTEYLAYSAYYAGGVRVVQFGAGGIRETGKFIDAGGSNFWGIEQFTTPGGDRLLAASDRDFGLYILRYTGPGAAQRPVCSDDVVNVQAGRTVQIPLRCTDANGNPLTYAIATPPTNGTLSAIQNGSVVYAPRSGFVGSDSFRFFANDGAANSAPATVRINVVSTGRCLNRIVGTVANDVLNGTPFGDAILGGAGNDTITGAQGDDCLNGQAGNDELTGADGNDELTGEAGTDRLFGDSGRDTLRGNAGRDHLRGGSGNDRLRGDDGNDFLSGGSNSDSLIGGSGRDSLRGDAGNDRIQGNAGNDSIDAGKGTNRISAGSGNDRVTAVNGRRDRISCGRGRDRVRADRADRVGRSCEIVRRTRRTR